jgi:osmotically-inducible protein OsmY
VKSAIATDVGARTAAAINIETYRGVVQLTGFADSPEQAAKAEAAAKEGRRRALGQERRPRQVHFLRKDRR